MNKDLFNQLLAAMLEGEPGISDLLFIPGRPPQMDSYGKLHPYEGALIEPVVTPQLAEQLATIVMDNNERLAEDLRANGSCDA